MSKKAPPRRFLASVFGEQTVTLELLEPIPAGQWTCFTRNCTDGATCLGFLPGDVDGNLTTDYGDLLALLDAFHTSNDPTSVDMNHDGTLGPEDLLRLIDLMNGGGPYEMWMGASLNECPSKCERLNCDE